MVTVKNKRVAIIAFDGLAAAQFQGLLEQMPATASLLQRGCVTELDAAPFCEAAPIWAEILTGQEWYRNGCAGYATPLHSVNELKIFSERDLCIEARLLPEVSEDQHNIVINVPILEPQNKNRIWLADASAPTLTAVYPKSLLNEEPFKSYKPRPLISMGTAMVDPAAIDIFIANEINRVRCAQTLSEDANWKLLIYRATIFDHLAHLLGPTFLSDSQLKASKRIQDFLAVLDKSIFEIISSADDYLFLSAFSHATCKEIFSLNDFFQSLHLLTKTDGNSSKNDLRRLAFSVVNSGTESGAPLVSQTTNFDATQTICASPIRGCVYINSKARFCDGKVDEADMRFQEDRIASILLEELNKFSHTGLLSRNPNSESKLQTPNFVVNIPGVDLVDNLPTIKRNIELPASVHDSRGFIWSRAATKAKSIKPAEILGLLSDLN